MKASGNFSIFIGVQAHKNNETVRMRRTQRGTRPKGQDSGRKSKCLLFTVILFTGGHLLEIWGKRTVSVRSTCKAERSWSFCLFLLQVETLMLGMDWNPPGAPEMKDQAGQARQVGQASGWMARHGRQGQESWQTRTGQEPKKQDDCGHKIKVSMIQLSRQYAGQKHKYQKGHNVPATSHTGLQP